MAPKCKFCCLLLLSQYVAQCRQMFSLLHVEAMLCNREHISDACGVHELNLCNVYSIAPTRRGIHPHEH